MKLDKILNHNILRPKGIIMGFSKQTSLPRNTCCFMQFGSLTKLDKIRKVLGELKRGNTKSQNNFTF